MPCRPSLYSLRVGVQLELEVHLPHVNSLDGSLSSLFPMHKLLALSISLIHSSEYIYSLESGFILSSTTSFLIPTRPLLDVSQSRAFLFTTRSASAWPCSSSAHSIVFLTGSHFTHAKTLAMPPWWPLPRRFHSCSRRSVRAPASYPSTVR